MHRLLIVDDEPVIVEGLEELLRQQQGLELDICKAYSALEAVEWIRSTKMDIVLSDIQMPEMNGLQLLDEIHFYWPDCRVIFLTGHDIAEYMYASFKKKADNYILKTEDDEVIVGAVIDVLDKLQAESSRLERMDATLRQLELMEPLMKKEILETFLVGEYDEDAYSREIWQRYGLKLQLEEPVQLLLAKPDAESPRKNAGRMELLALIRETALGCLPASILSEGLVYQNKYVVWLLQPDPRETRFHHANKQPDWDCIRKYLKGALEPLQHHCRQASNLEMSLFLAKEAVEWPRLHEEFDFACSIAEKIRFGHQTALVDLSVSFGTDEGAIFDPSEATIVERVHRFIRHNMDGDLSLAKIAESVYFNPSYLSRYYKQTTGGNLSDYIQSVRADAAARMLQDPQLKINEVASRVGFESPSYFTAFFRKASGLSPQEYREAWLLDEQSKSNRRK